MKEERIKYDNLVVRIKNDIRSEIKRDIIILGIALLVIVIAFFIIIGFNELTPLLFIVGAILVLLAFDIIIKLLISNNKLKRLSNYKDEINNNCEVILGHYNCFYTDQHLINMNFIFGKFDVVAFNEIVSITDRDARGYEYVTSKMTDTLIKLSNGKKISIITSENETQELKKVLNKHYHKEERKEINDIKKENSSHVDYKSKYIKELDISDEETTGTIYFPYLNRDIDICGYGNIDVSYIDKVVNHISQMNDESFNSAIEGTISYYNAVLKKDGYWSSLKEENIPIRITRDNIKSLKMDSIELIESNKDIVFNIHLSCPWGHEESMVWSFINDKNVYIGSEFPVNPLDNYFINNNSNYSLLHHNRVSLTDSEYQEIENNYNNKED